MKHFQQPLTIAARGLLGRCRDNVRPGGLGVAPETGAAEDAKAGMWVLPGSGKPKAINPLQTTFTTLWHAAQQLSGPFHLPAAAVLGSRGAVSTPTTPAPAALKLVSSAHCKNCAPISWASATCTHPNATWQPSSRPLACHLQLFGACIALFNFRKRVPLGQRQATSVCAAMAAKPAEVPKRVEEGECAWLSS